MIAFALLCAALIGLIVYLLHHSAAQGREWARERQLLISRIQHPEIIPTEAQIAGGPAPGIPKDYEPPTPTDDIDLVGTVQTFDGSDD